MTNQEGSLFNLPPGMEIQATTSQREVELGVEGVTDEERHRLNEEQTIVLQAFINKQREFIKMGKLKDEA